MKSNMEAIMQVVDNYRKEVRDLYKELESKEMEITDFIMTEYKLRCENERLRLSIERRDTDIKNLMDRLSDYN